MSADAARADAGARVRVLLPISGLAVLDYLVPDGLMLAPGDLVRVPLGRRQLVGVVWDAEAPAAKPVDPKKMKPVLERLELPGLDQPTRRFIQWVARYYLAAPNTVLRMALSAPQAFDPLPTRQLLRRSGKQPDRMTPARQKLLTALPLGECLAPGALAERAGVSAGVVRGLLRDGALEAQAAPADAPYPSPDPDCAGPQLSPQQGVAAAALVAMVKAGDYQACLLEGVTGSGKTEVYFEAIAAALATPGAQVLVLVPEIGLTAQWLERFAERFGAPPVLWHSDLGAAERRRAWRAVNLGQARVVVGARSALFLPYRDLRLIVVDEEHDPSFKQEDGLCYHARDMAVVRGHLTGCPVLLASATPSLETIQNVAAGRYRRVELPSRFGGAQLPDIETVDMRRVGLPAGRWLSPPLVAAVKAAMERGEQSLLFLNRRGYAPLTLCRTCGERLECPQCTAWLVEHRLEGRLTCHHCGFSLLVPKACPHCHAEASLVACGPGVERLAEEARAQFPDARLLEVTSDHLGGPKRAAALVAAVTAGAVDIIIGTQLVTKGYDFPKLTLVGVIDADLGLTGGDLRAAERSFQQLTQVAGRAGRGQARGRVLVQTHMPENPVMAALLAGDQDAFLTQEAIARQRGGMPPFGRLAAIIVSGKDQAAVTQTARALGQTAPHGAGIAVLGPAPAPLALLRGRYRQRLLVKADKGVAVQGLIRAWLARVPRANDVRIAIDIDPYSFL